MTIEEFLRDRLRELRDLTWEHQEGVPHHVALQTRKLIQNQEKIIEWHQNWPVLIQTEPELRRSDESMELGNARLEFSQKFNWMTQQQYREIFGDEPPTAPLLRQWVKAYRAHPDFDPSWVGEFEERTE